jgi:hypothetical protein
MHGSTFKNTIRIPAMTLLLLASACATSTKRVHSANPATVNVTVEAIELAAAFEQSEIRAIEMFVGKRARINGRFAKTESLSDGRIAMTFKSSKETFRPVRCVIDAEHSGELDELESGDPVTVIGEIQGFAESRYFVTVDACTLDP